VAVTKGAPGTRGAACSSPSSLGRPTCNF
jgi:hypothetical protein